jgi:geranylgeranyl diphosphate synthase type I
VRELVRGQVEDVAFEGRSDVGVQECLDMAAGKTGSLLAAAASIGAVLAGAPTTVTAALQCFGAELGTAFQLVDDLLGIWGDPAITGKPVRSDLRSRKMSLPVTYAVNHGGADGRVLAAWLAGTAARTEPELHRAAALVEAGGGRDWAAAEARRRLALAEKALAGADLPDRPRAELVALGRHLAEREF